jgi:hypothetical protein
MTVPVEFSSGELWGDGAGSADALTVNFAAGSADPVWILGQTEIVGTAVVSTTAADYVELRFDFSLDNQVSYIPLPSEKLVEDTIEQGTLIVRLPGEVGTHPFVVKLPYSGYVRVMARRVGGAVDTNLYLSGFSRPQGKSGGQSGSAGSVAGISRLESVTNAFHSAGSAVTLTGTYVAGDWIDTGQATEVWLGLELSNASGTTVEIDVQWRQDSADTIKQFPAESSVAAGKSTVRDLYYEHDGTIGNHSLNLQVPPLHQFRIRAKYTGGSAPDLLAVAHLLRP